MQLNLAIETLEKIHQQGVVTANDQTREIVAPEFGQYIAQGDLNIWWLGELPPSAVPAADDRQLAPGTTRGSRHCIRAEDMANVEFYRLDTATPLHGPVLRLLAPVTIEHPEHGDQVWPVGIIAITYQRLHGVELRRAAD